MVHAGLQVIATVEDGVIRACIVLAGHGVVEGLSYKLLVLAGHGVVVTVEDGGHTSS